MIRSSIALALLIAIGGSASAATPRLKELVTVTSEIVRIGDLVENAGAATDVPVFRAPDLGQTGAVPVSQVTEALRPYDMSNIDTAGLTEVVVTRLSRAITTKEISERISRAVSGQYGYGDAQNLAVILDRGIQALHVEAAATAELVVSRMYVDPRTGRFDVSLELPGSAVARRMPLRFTGTVSETLETATLARAIRPGQIIKASDVVMERKPRAEVGNDSLGADQAIGLTAKNILRAGQALRAGDLMKPLVVQRNEGVTMTYEVPGILLSVRGKALENGAVGDVIGVLNIQSNRTVQATVVAPGRVVVVGATPLRAAANNTSSDDQNSNPTQ